MAIILPCKELSRAFPLICWQGLSLGATFGQQTKEDMACFRGSEKASDPPHRFEHTYKRLGWSRDEICAFHALNFVSSTLTLANTCSQFGCGWETSWRDTTFITSASRAFYWHNSPNKNICSLQDFLIRGILEFLLSSYSTKSLWINGNIMSLDAIPCLVQLKF